MMKKPVATHKRALLLELTSARKLSISLQEKIARIIGNMREKSGHEAAEAKAEELTELINRCETEEEILEAIKGM